jgi:cysteinyl-tRNA synthetase
MVFMVANQQDNKSAETTTAFEADPDHASAVNQAIQAIRELVQANPEFGDQLRLAASTDDVRKLLQAKGIDITDEALWRHRGALLGDGSLTWRG